MGGIRGVPTDRRAYCAMDLEGQASKVLCTNLVPQKNPIWTNKAEFQTKQPLPGVRVRLFVETHNPLMFEGRLIGKVGESVGGFAQM